MIISWTLTFALVLGGMCFAAPELLGASKQVVTAKHVKKAPVGLDDSVWQQAQAVSIPMEGKEKFADKKTTVTTRALYTDDSIHFLFTWDDPTLSLAKKSWQLSSDGWRQLDGDEDRLALLFEINRINQFATKGCTVLCHSSANTPKKEWKLAANTETEKGDLWHWKAVRSAPYNHADDGWLTVSTQNQTGRKNDAGKGGDITNQTADKSKPRYMQNPAKPPSVQGFLLAEEAVEITDYALFKVGAVIPSRLPKQPDGSRFDVKATSRYANGGWTLMLSRKLDTGQEDDVAFNPRREYSFAMAVFDDSGDENSYDSEPLTLQFGR
jgi:hypothetical protein